MLAIIGTAGRNTDARRINPAIYDAMYVEALRALRDWGLREAVSGGAAVADHLAVRAFLEGEVDRLVLHLPAPFVDGRYVRPQGSTIRDADTANQYHAAFSRACGVDSLGELAEAIARGAETAVGRGFKDRNSTVARDATHMIALTFGPGREPVDVSPSDPGFGAHREAGVKDGGTEDTWNKAWRCQAKRHVPLCWLERVIATAPPAPPMPRATLGRLRPL